MQSYQQQWFGNIRGDILSGIVVALALIPEAIAFSIIAGVDPMVGLYASFIIAVIISFVGGRPGMISAATGSMALLMGPLVKNYGLDYLLAATILTGILQLLFGFCRVAKIMQFIPNSVMIGFVNALAILIFMAQVPHVLGGGVIPYILVAVTLLIVYTVPRFIKVIPAPLIAIIVLTAVVIFTGTNVKTIGDLGTIQQSLPHFFIPNIPWNFETLQIIFPYAFALAIVGLLESLLTAQIVDEMSETESNKNKEARGQGIANVINGFFGGMAGCAMIGQSVINMKSNGRGRLSTFVAGMFLMFLILVLGSLVVQIPMAVLVGIMVMVSIGTFDWHSFYYIAKAPRTDAIVMILTVAIVVYTNDLSKGVIAGVILSALFFVIKVAHVQITKVDNHYVISGPLFFATTTHFINYFKQVDTSEKIVLDFTPCRMWDESAVNALSKVKQLLKDRGIEATIVGLDEASSTMIKKLQ